MWEFPLPVAGALATIGTADIINLGTKVPAFGITGGSFHILQMVTFGATVGAGRYICGKGNSAGTLGTWHLETKDATYPTRLSLVWNRVTTNTVYTTLNTDNLLDNTGPVLIGMSVDLTAGVGLKCQVFTRKTGESSFRSSTFTTMTEGSGDSVTDDQALTVAGIVGSSASAGATHHFFAYWEGAATLDVFENMLIGDNLTKYLANAVYIRPGMHGGTACPDEGGSYGSHGTLSGMEVQPMVFTESFDDQDEDSFTGFHAAGTVFSDVRADIIAGLTSAQAEAHGWNVETKAALVAAPTAVVRTSDTVVTVTLPAVAAYAITAQETVTATIPATAVASALPIVATPAFTVDPVPVGGTIGTLVLYANTHD